MPEVNVRILGKTAKEVGNNLELLAKELLAQLGYGSFIRNAYKTGAEIDLRAAHRITAAPLLAECKARSKPIDAPTIKLFFAEWQKERAKNDQLFGLIISTSGFTGTATQWYLELDPNIQKALRLLDSEQLISHLVSADLTLSPSAIHVAICDRHQLGTLEATWLTFSQYGFAWISVFVLDDGRRLYTIVDERGRPFQSWKAREIVELIRRHFRGADFFGLDLREKIQRHLLRRSGSTLETLVQETGESEVDVYSAIQLLKSDGRIRGDHQNVELDRNLITFLNMAREFLNGPHAEEFLSSAFTQEYHDGN